METNPSRFGDRRNQTIAAAELLLARAAAPLCVIDDNLVILVASGGFCRLLGHSQEELLGYRLTELLNRDGSNLASVLRDRRDRNELSEFCIETRYRRYDGTVVSVRNHISAMVDSDDCLTGFLLMAEDLTAARSSKAHIVRLERRLARKGRELAKAEAESLLCAKMKSSFIANANHELRTPLSIILGSNSFCCKAS